MESIKVTTDTLRQLARYDTPTICNVIELFDIRPRDAGYMDCRIKAAFPDFPPMVGIAATATMRCASPLGQSTYDAMEAQLRLFEQLTGPAVVVFQDLDDPPVAATFGEVMCSTYQAFGAVGIITSGSGRDLAQVRALGFPAFTASMI
jgi:4-hydroxy-4-methyl-2-oxoglutarate aldolase